MLYYNHIRRIFLIASLLFSFGLCTLSAQSANNDWSKHKAKNGLRKRNGSMVFPSRHIHLLINYNLQSNIILIRQLGIKLLLI